MWLCVCVCIWYMYVLYNAIFISALCAKMCAVPCCCHGLTTKPVSEVRAQWHDASAALATVTLSHSTERLEGLERQNAIHELFGPALNDSHRTSLQIWSYSMFFNIFTPNATRFIYVPWHWKPATATGLHTSNTWKILKEPPFRTHSVICCNLSPDALLSHASDAYQVVQLL